ncbi:MAG TPA: beta-ketoacyl reductase, partial [Geminicoccus sp.]|uniref:beta-ketoacyl reductase n=1 Tax=Geminicoccus sp. TaxID=2024832 RepID=UPI002D1ABEE7
IGVDIADEPAVAAAMAGLDHPLKGVFHLAGALDDGVLAAQTPERLATTLLPKLEGAQVLDRLTRSAALDHFVLFGSLAGPAGAAGQANYAAANAALAALARQRQADGLPALLVDWAAWSGSGMAAGRAGAAIAPAAALDALGELLCGTTLEAAVLPAATVAAATATAEPVLDLDGLPASERRFRLEELVRHHARQVLELGDLPLDPARPLTELGLDSLMAVELRNALVRALARPLPPTLVLDHPSVELLTAHLATLWTEPPPVPAPPPASPAQATPADDDSVIDELEQELLRAGY